MPTGKHLFGALALLALATPVEAQGSSPDIFKFSGFGTLAATRSSEKNADFITNYSMPNGPGFTRSTDFSGDSRVGLQADIHFSEAFSATLQVISEHRYDDTFKPYLGIGQIKFQVTPNFAIRAGRLPYAAYLISDYQKVGFAQPWVRPPVEVYQFNPLTSVDGADITLQFNLGAVSFTGKLAGGSSTAKLTPSSYAVKYATPGTTPEAEWKSKNLGAVSLAAFYSHATFRAFHLQMKGTYEDPGFDGPAGPVAGMSPFRALRTLPAAFGGNPTLADQFQITDDKLNYDSVAFNYDPGNWFLMIEQTKKSGDENMFLHFTAGYATLGIRFGDWTPYVTAGWKHTTSPTTNPNPIINSIVSGLDRGQTSYSGGLRWDFYTNLALKVQFDSVKNSENSSGATTNAQPAYKPGQSYNLTTLALDFVF